MAFESINPADGKPFKVIDAFSSAELEAVLQEAARAAPGWRERGLPERCALLRQAAVVLRDHAEDFARMMTLEMGKPIGEARAEIEKCAWVCEYYADEGPTFLADEVIASDAGIGREADGVQGIGLT